MKKKSIKGKIFMSQIAAKDSIINNISIQLGRGIKKKFIDFGNDLFVVEEASNEVHKILAVENYKKKL